MNNIKKIGIIHTTPATIASMKQLVLEKIDHAEVINILDDSILGDMRDKRAVHLVRKRWLEYAGILKELGVHAVVSACSTVGEIADEAAGLLDIPVMRIDEAMAEKAVNEGSIIDVLATLNSTLEPTVKLIVKKAQEADKEVQVNTVLVEGAYEALMQGNQEEHNQKIQAAVQSSLNRADIIVLAQASMALSIQGDSAGDRILTSPVLGIEKLSRMLQDA